MFAKTQQRILFIKCFSGDWICLEMYFRCLHEYLNDGEYWPNTCMNASGFAHLRTRRESILPYKTEKRFEKEHLATLSETSVIYLLTNSLTNS